MADQAGEWRAEIGDVRGSPDGRVALQFRFELKGGRSGIVAERRMGMVVTVCRGKIARTEALSSWDDALKAVGLEE
jgi:hypothetical protein